jgi:hypothetical protein
MTIIYCSQPSCNRKDQEHGKQGWKFKKHGNNVYSFHTEFETKEHQTKWFQGDAIHVIERPGESMDILLQCHFTILQFDSHNDIPLLILSLKRLEECGTGMMMSEDLYLAEIQILVELQDRRLAKELGKKMYLLFLPSRVPSMIEEVCYFRQDKCHPSLLIGM